MSQDQQFYQRATRAALVGLVVQIILGIGVALVGLWAQSPALNAATWHFFGGVPIWIILLALYYQHKLERIESLEAEQLSRSDAQAAALFDEAADDLQLAKRRLENLYKYGLPIVSLLVAVYLLIAGGVMFYQARSAFHAGSLVKDALGNPFAASLPGLFKLFWLAVIMAFVSFIVARYVSGMTQIREWQLLRGGASYLMGTTLVSVLVFVGAFVSWIREGNTEPFALLSLVVPALMILVGLEIGLTLVLGMYRPRKPDEIPRPAFDSRVLGLLTKPESIAIAVGETINYQFGFEVSRSWFYQLLSRSITPLVGFGAAVLILLSCVVVVEPQEQAIITQSGRMVGEPLNPGMHLKAPWPFGKAEHYPTERVQQVIIGSVAIFTETNKALLWTNDHGADKEQYIVTAPTPINTSNQNLLLSNFLQQGPTGGKASGPGMSLVGAQVTVQFKIKDLQAYVTAAANPRLLLESLAEREVTSMFATQTIDRLIGPERIGIADELKTRIQKAVDQGAHDNQGKASSLGLEIVFVGFAAVHPPKDSEVAASFQEQIGALQEKQATIEKANQDATGMLATVAGSREKAEDIDKAITSLVMLKGQVEDILKSGDQARLKAKQEEVAAQESKVEDLLAAANGRAAVLISEARAYRWQRAISEQAKAERFKAELASYGKAPSLYRTRRYLEVMSDGLANSRKIVIASQHNDSPVFRMDMKDNLTNLDNIFKY